MEGWEKKESKAGKTYGGATQEGVATAIVQGGRQTAARIGGPTQNWEKKGGCG
jgi:hypothetical protein